MEHAVTAAHVLVQIAMGISLSACAGLRAFLPIFVIGLLSRLGYIEVGPTFAWVGSTPSLIVFGGASVTEIMGDKIPAVDHFLDSAGVIIKPVAGTVLFSSMIVKMDPMLAVVPGLIVGGSIAEVIHVKKSALRLASSALTGGVANPVVSVAEDVGTGVGIALSIIVPILAVFIVFLGIYISFKLYRNYIEKKEAARLEKEKQKMLEKAAANGKLTGIACT